MLMLFPAPMDPELSPILIPEVLPTETLDPLHPERVVMKRRNEIVKTT